MEEIKENEYVRLRDGEVTRVKAINKKTFKCKFHKVNCELFIDYIVKHSSNIIDLIEVGDYVNGSEVVAEKYKNYDMNFINVDSKISFGWGYGVIPENDIKSIVAKEQFTSMEYRLEE